MKQQLHTELGAAVEYFNRSTAALTEEDASFTPTDGMFITAQQVAHAALTIDWFMEGAFRPDVFHMDFEAHDRKVRDVATLSEARAWFDMSVESAKQTIDAKSNEESGQALPAGPVMGGAPRAAIFSAITDHTAHHRGALTVYARLQGKTPPMPYMDPPPSTVEG
jgi:uncharacterized damage-inducible protein DinB